MVRILLAEDDHQKAERVSSLITRVLLHDKPKIILAHSVYDAGRILMKDQIDVVILDVNLPLKSSESPVTDGGIVLLRHIRDNRRLKTPSHIIGLTAYDELQTKFETEFSRDMWYLIKYEPHSDAWEDVLSRRLTHVCASNQRPQHENRHEQEDELSSLSSAQAFAIPLQLLRESIKAVPALRYGMGVVGLVAIIAIVSLLRVGLAVALCGAVIAIFLMALVLVFSRLSTTPKRHFLIPALVLMWGVLVLVFVSALLLVSSIFFHKPLNLEHWINTPSKNAAAAS
jgi:CheY-like chemotaxis protein